MFLLVCLAVTCAPDQFACRDGTCVSTTQLCDGTADCADGEDENRTICYSILITPSQPHVTPTAPTSGISHVSEMQGGVLSGRFSDSLLFLQLVDPLSSAVPLVASVCLRPGGVMGRQTVWTGVMSSSAPLPVAPARFRASVGTSVLTTTSSVTGLHIAGTPQMRA